MLAETEGKVCESEPSARRDDVAREDIGISKESDQIQRGITRSLRDQWKNMSQRSESKERTPIKLYEDEGRVLENEPTRREVRISVCKRRALRQNGAR